ncbi:MAG: flagellar assembly peptidoglycan hydrolase FlgJ [Acidobacteriota bacterium]
MWPTDTSLTPLSAQTLNQDIERIAAPTGMGGSAGFQALFNQVQGEVADFIANGSTEAPAPALNAQGWLVQQRLQAPTESQQAFLDQIAPWAQTSAAELGVAPELVAAHAALESGWGQKPLRLANGQDSLNVFSIKAQGGWQGPAVSATTTEYEQGQPVKQTEAFRAYPDYAAAFRDYTQLLTRNPRYQGALRVGDDAQAFAQGLARGGYATDPHYADKLTSVAAMVKARAASTHSRD